MRLNTVSDALRDVEAGQTDTLNFEPGTRHVYLNAGFTVLGRIVELASGRDYYEYIEERVFRPAGMEQTGWPRADFLVPNVAGYYWRDYNNDERRWRRGAGGSGGDLRGNPETSSVSNAHDILRFAEALRVGKLVSPESLKLFWSAKPELGAPNWGYGFSYERDDRIGRMVGHGGTGGPVSNSLDMFLDSGYTAVILSNYSGGRFAPRAKIRSLLPSATSSSLSVK